MSGKAGLDDKAYEKANYKPVEWEQTEEMKPLTFPHILALMIFLSIGMLIGTLVFLIEICSNKGKMGNNSIYNFASCIIYLISGTNPEIETCPQADPPP